MPSIRQIVSWIQGLVNWLNGLDESTKKVIDKVALVTAALEPMLIVVGKVVGAVGAILTVVSKITGALSSVTVFMSVPVIPAISSVEAFWAMVVRICSALSSLLRRALQWGRDFINGIVDGIRSAIENVVSVVSDVADAIWSYLHFSVPDVEPLTNYGRWMPDFMGRLAKGIEKSRELVKKAVDSVAANPSGYADSTGTVGLPSSR